MRARIAQMLLSCLSQDVDCADQIGFALTCIRRFTGSESRRLHPRQNRQPNGGSRGRLGSLDNGTVCVTISDGRSTRIP